MTNTELVNIITVDITNTVSAVYLRELLRAQLSTKLRTIEWVDNTNSKILISHDHRTIKKVEGDSNWDRIARSKYPLTRGVNSLEFRLQRLPNAREEPSIVIGVHPTPDCEAGMCQPGVHVSSVGVTFNTDVNTDSVQTGGDTLWMIGNIIRVEVDFFNDEIRVLCNGEVKIKNAPTHKLSDMPNCYFNFMICFPDVEICILNSSVIW
jgi:hypothetical protein